ncbi:3-oxoacyl-ACP reductase FabG [Candidatus Korarchaeum cryptofilum]|jgi:3-oxoacyl-[acyl-carrier protein] reductase|uniref:3-oxoacyl-ACP reductase FabG n=1 Tax=Candidatus Korarchaeum cryptofilum TaxID=498846 RepID=A0A429G0X3_9CREN|nr:3-oxoacyl-ACP reductase family protein [Candidatus Korarchaeum cryptofilum]RSN67491.1 3-oxoacyl-ACP reductase FabG [Candidatus Korarchaeum cryptofilum]
MRFDGKVALVTGASRGIGRAIALALAREGANVIVNYSRDDAKAREVVDSAKSLGSRAIMVRADVSNPMQIEEMERVVREEFGRLDILVNSAGITLRRPLEEVPYEEWRRVMEVNLNGAFYVMRAFFKLMADSGGGSIINIASVAGYIPMVGSGAYSPSKAGLIMLTELAAAEWAEYGIRVNAVCPGPIETDMLREEFTEEQLEIRKRLIPLGRLGRTDDVVKLVLFLASEDSSYITGESFIVDGGMAVSYYLLMEKLFKVGKKILEQP